jgi:hypothetical protein
MKIRLNAATRLMASEWWDALSEEAQKEYIAEHPDSEYAQDHVQTGPGVKPPVGDRAIGEHPMGEHPNTGTPSTDPDKPDTVNAPAGEQRDYKRGHGNEKREKKKEITKEPLVPQESEESEEDEQDDQDDQEKKPAKPEAKKPKKKGWDENAETNLLKYLLHKSGRGVKKGLKKGLEKGGKEALRRLIDPMALTDVGKKGTLPELPFRFKSKKDKVKTLKDQLSKLNKKRKGFGDNVPSTLDAQIKVLKEKLKALEE